MSAVAQTNDARVLTMLRQRPLTRYQIQELLGAQVEKAGDGLVNKLLDSMWDRNLIGREGIKYMLTKRGTNALALIDDARAVHRRTPFQWAEDYSSNVPANDPAPPFTHVEEQVLKRSPPHRSATAAELRGTPPRAGSLAFLDAPSRFGNTLHYRDGRITDMDGAELQPAFRFTGTKKGE